jgi:hypothetical protein
MGAQHQDWLTDRQLQCDFDFDLSTGFQLRVQLWSINQQTIEAKIQYQETSSEDISEELPLQRAITK